MEENVNEAVRPEQGEHWYVQYPGTLTVSEAYVLDVTAHTCLLRDKLITYAENRYKIEDIKWIEKLDRGG